VSANVRNHIQPSRQELCLPARGLSTPSPAQARKIRVNTYIPDFKTIRCDKIRAQPYICRTVLKLGVSVRIVLTPLIIAFALAAFAPACLAQVHAEGRFALLIGNQNYKPDVGPLTNPQNDVVLLERALESIGFDVTVVRDAELGAIYQALNAHIHRLQAAGPGAIGFFYYSGHGAANDENGADYLIPVDTPTIETTALWDLSMRLGEITSKLKTEAGNATHFVVIDARRNKLKLKKPGTKALTQSKGFRAFPSEAGMLIAFATAEGELSSDEGDGGGPYSRVLAEEIVKPNTESVTMFRRVQVRVRSEIGQEPWINFNSLGEIYLAGLDNTVPRADYPISAMSSIPRTPPSVTISGKPEAVCDDLKGLVTLAEQNFSSIKGIVETDGTWKTSATISGFRECKIMSLDYFTYMCEATASQTQTQAQQEIANMAASAESCLGSSWQRFVSNDTSIALTRKPDNAIILTYLINNNPVPNTLVFNIYKREAPEVTDLPSTPKSYCDGLKRVLGSAKKQFDDIIGIKRFDSPYYAVSRVQLDGWQECIVYNVDRKERESRYFSCEIRQSGTRLAAVDQMTKTISKDMKTCLGNDWGVKQRRRTDGTLAMELFSGGSKAAIEVYASKDLTYEFWNTKLNINLAAK
jgi:hypothetical protein